MARWTPLLLSSFLLACSDGLDAYATDYVALALAWGEQDRGYVDAYYGPEINRPSPDAHEIRERALALEGTLQDLPGPRARRLRRLVRSLVGRIDVAEGRIHRFDDESAAIIGIVPPRSEPPRRPMISTERLVVSSSAIAQVLEAALDECRERTQRHVELPEGEAVRLELVHGRPWAAYHRYEGRYQSVVQFNLDFPLYVDRALDEMCHEAYPGHHVQQVLMERHLVEARGFGEYALLPESGPVPFVAEGSARYAVELLFPPDERLQFERDVLYPLAGLDPSAAEAQAAARRERKALEPALLEAARRNLDGDVDLYSAALWLEERGVSEPRATLEYVWLVRSHIAAYTYGETLVRRYVEREREGTPSGSRASWDALIEIWTTPLFPEEL